MSKLTKHSLEQSLKNLLKTKPLNRITINDLVEECGISRMTFYYHFQDIYDLVEWSCLEDAKKALKGRKTYSTWQEGFIDLFHAVYENKPFIMNVYHCVSIEQVQKYLKPLTDQLLLDVLNELSKDMVIQEQDKQFIAKIYSYMFIGVMLDWIRNDMKEDPKTLVSRFGKAIQNDFINALERFRLDGKHTDQ